MKRSEFERRFINGYTDRATGEDAQVAAELAEAAGVTRDPEEPEVLWEGVVGTEDWQYRLIRAGKGAEWRIGRAGNEKSFESEPLVSTSCQSALDELARRILAEREEKTVHQSDAEVEAAIKTKAGYRGIIYTGLSPAIQSMLCDYGRKISAEAQKNVALQAEVRAMLDTITGLREEIAAIETPTVREEKMRDEALHAYRELNERNRRLMNIRLALEITPSPTAAPSTPDSQTRDPAADPEAALQV